VEAMLSGLLEWQGAPLGLDILPNTTSPEPACILTSVVPRVNSVRNMIPTTLAVLHDEVARGLECVWEIQEGRRPWASLLLEADPLGEPARVELSVIGVRGEAKVACQGWLAGRILGLLIDLERRPGLPMRPYPPGARFDMCLGLLRAPEGEERLKIAESVEDFIIRFDGWSERPPGAVLRWSLVGGPSVIG